MNIIDLIDQANPVRYSAPEGQRFIIPRLKGVTQIIAGKTNAEALAHYKLTEEVVTKPDNPDDVLQIPQQVDGVWTTVWVPRAYTAEEIAAMKVSAIHQINNHYDAIVNSLADYYPDYERDTWPQQESEARAWDADNSASTPVIDAILAVRTSVTKADFVATIITKADAYRALAAQYVGTRQVKRDAVNAAATKAEIDAILAAL